MTPRALSALASLGLLMTLAGCASRALDIGYPQTSAHRALLAGGGPRRIVATVADRRADTSRIGVAPEDAKPIVTARPVPDIVHDALVTELSKNGHEVVPGPADVVLAVDVEEFWLDAVGRADSAQYVGRVAIAIVVADGQTGHRLLTRRYVGIRRRTGSVDSRDTWHEVMATALARMIHDVATDRELAATVGGTRL